MAATASKYKLLYWPGIPGRGEFVRLAFEYAKQPYEQNLDVPNLMAHTKPGSTPKGEPHAFAPPMLEHEGHLISQTPNILLYIGETLGLAGSRPVDKFFVNQLTLTILDLNNEVHDTVSACPAAPNIRAEALSQHHPVSVSAYYEDQKEESKRKAENVRNERLPKFLGYFEGVLKENGTGYLVGSKITYADLALFQVIDGCQFAFPKCLKRLQDSGKYRTVFELKQRIQDTPQVAEYLKSDRRQKYSMGIFRHYPELDD